MPSVATSSKTKNNPVEKLRDLSRYCARRMGRYREGRRRIVHQVVGRHYSDNGYDKPIPVNWLELAVSVHLYHLASGQPQAKVSTPHRMLKPMAYDLTQGINYTLNEVKFGATLKGLCMDALMGPGIARIGLNASRSVEIDGVLHDSGQVFIDRIDLEDALLDMTAPSWDRMQYAGNRYIIPREAAFYSGLYNKKVIESIEPVEFNLLNEDGDERLSNLSGSEVASSTAEGGFLEEHIELYDVWIPRWGIEPDKMCTFAMTGAKGYAREDEWYGPEAGPYRYLSFLPVPNNLLPVSLAAQWQEKHDLANMAYRKMSQQLRRQKTVGFVRSGAERDGQRIQDASDGEIAVTDDPRNLGELKFGGVDGGTYNFALHLWDRFSLDAGNLNSMGGLDAQTDTVGQERLIAASSSRRLQEMQASVVQFTSGIIRDVAWYLMTDPLIELPIAKRLPSGRELPTVLRAEDIEGDFLDYNFQVVPYSLKYQTPDQQAQELLGLLQTVVMPLMPFMEQQGLVLDTVKLMEILADSTQRHELTEIIRNAQGATGPQRMPVGTPPPKATTPKEYVHTHRAAGGGNRQRAGAMPTGQQQSPTVPMGES